MATKQDRSQLGGELEGQPVALERVRNDIERREWGLSRCQLVQAGLGKEEKPTKRERGKRRLPIDQEGAILTNLESDEDGNARVVHDSGKTGIISGDTSNFLTIRLHFTQRAYGDGR